MSAFALSDFSDGARASLARNFGSARVVAHTQLAAASSLPWLDALAGKFFQITCRFFNDCTPLELAENAAAPAPQLPRPPQPTLQPPRAAISSPREQPAQQPIQQIINQPVIERRTETVRVETGLSSSEIDARFAALEKSINQRLASASPSFSGPAASTPVSVQTFAVAQKIDNLSGVDIEGGTITNATISGGSIDGGTITGTIGATINSLLGTIADLTSNTIVATNATTTNLAVTGTATIGSATGVLQTTSGVVSTIASGANGQVLKIVLGAPTWSTDLQGSGGAGAWATTSDDLAIYPADTTDVVIVGSNATTSTGNILEVAGASLFRGALTAYNPLTAPRFTATSSVASQLPYASTTAISATTASSSNLIASNTFTLSNVTGFLKATAGAVATAAIDLANDVTGILGVARGGTGWSNIASGAVVLGNGTGALATTSAGTNGQVLALVSGVPSWVATTTFSAPLVYSNGNVTLSTSGNWTGTFDGQEGNYYLNANNLTNFGTPFFNFFSATTTDALAQGATNRYYADTFVQSFVHGSSTIPKTYTNNTFTGGNVFGNATTTNLAVLSTASTSALIVSNLNAADCDVKASPAGVLSCGTDATGGGGASFGQAWEIGGNGFAGFLAPTTTQKLWLGQASSTLLSAHGAFFGATATSSFNSAGVLTLAANPNGPLDARNGVVGATTSVGVLYGGTGATSASQARTNLAAAASGANADITSLSALTHATTSFLFVNSALFNSAAIGGTATSTFSSNGSISVGNALTVSGNTTLSHSTTTSLFVNSPLFNSAAIGGTATSTFGSNGALSLAGALTLSGTPNGPLHANNGLVAATTSIGVLYGGTGLTSIGVNQLIIGNSGGSFAAIATSTLFSNSSQLASWLSDETGTGAFVLATAPTLASPTFTGLSSFTLASSTQQSILDGLFVGRTATTTIRGDGVASIIPYASTTALTVSGTASTSALIVSGLNAASCDVKSSITGVLSCGTDATGGSGTWPFTPGTFGATAVQATTTALQLQGGLFASSTVRFGNAGVSPFFFDGSVGRVGVGTTSPWALLSVDAPTGVNSFAIGSSTATYFLVNSSGRVGIGTTSPIAKLAIRDTAPTTELVTNGTFTGSATGWVLQTGWSYASNQITSNGTSGAVASTTVPLVFGKSYRISFQVTTYTSGALCGDVGGANFLDEGGDGTGVYTAEVTVYNTSGHLEFSNCEDFIGSIDNVSVVELTPSFAAASDSGSLFTITTAGNSDLMLRSSSNLKFVASSTDMLFFVGTSTPLGIFGPDEPGDVTDFIVGLDGDPTLLTIGDGSSLRFDNVQTTRTFSLDSPNDGSGVLKWYLRLQPSNVFNVQSLRVTVRGRYDFGPVNGFLQAEYGYHAPGDNTLSTDAQAFRITSATGKAWENLRIGDVEVENGFVSIPIWAANSNEVLVTVEYDEGYLDIQNSLAVTSYQSSTLPALNHQSIQSNLGIGTTTPANKLHVFGDVRIRTGDKFYFEDSGTNNALYRQASDGSTVLTMPADADTIFGSGGLASTYMTIKSATGNVGIGTTSPYAKLSVNQFNGGTTPLFAVASSTGSGATSTAFIINHLGNVGIGTTTLPTNSRLVISGGGVSNGDTFTGSNSLVIDTDDGIGAGISLISSDVGGTQWDLYSTGSGCDLCGNAGNFAIFDSDDLTTRFLIDGSGNVGIGTTSPDEALVLSGNVEETVRMRIENLSTSAIESRATLRLTAGTAAEAEFVARHDEALSILRAREGGLEIGTDNALPLSFFTEDATRLTVAAGGNVGIGTTTPWRTFSVEGTVSFKNLTSNTGAAAASLCLSSTDEVTRNTDNETCITSSERYKENIETLLDGVSLDTLMQLRPVTFEYKDTPGLRYGLIAEEVDAVDKTLVGYDDEGLPNSVRYTSIIPLLINAVKQLAAKVSETAHLVIDTLTASIGNFGRVNTEELCVDDVCVTRDQFAEVFGNQSPGQSAAASAPASGEAEGASGGTSASENAEPPIIPPGDDTATTTPPTAANDNQPPAASDDAQAPPAAEEIPADQPSAEAPPVVAEEPAPELTTPEPANDNPQPLSDAAGQ